jgi:hypothetical protein
MPEMTYAVHTGTCTYLLDDEGICLWTLSPGGHAAPGTDRCVGAQFVACLDLTTPGGLVGELRIGAAALFARREHGRFVLLRTMPIERVEYRPQTEEDARAYRDALTSQDATAVLAAHEADVLLAGATPLVPEAPHAPVPQHHVPLPQPVPRHHAPPPAPSHHAPLPHHAPAPPHHAPLPHHPEPEPEVLRTAPLPDQPWPPRPPAATQQAPQPSPTSLQLTYETYGDEEEEAALDSEDLVSVSVTEVAITLPLYRPPPGAPPAPLPNYVLPPPAHPPPRPYAAPPPAPQPGYAEAADAGPPTPRGPPPARRGVVGPGRRLR